MRSLVDEMVAVGRTLDEDELLEYIITGRSHGYDPIVSAIITKIGAISVSELYLQLLAFASLSWERKKEAALLRTQLTAVVDVAAVVALAATAMVEVMEDVIHL
jgi:hypothetical protein